MTDTDNSPKRQVTAVGFTGFESPQENWSKLPHQFVDELPNFTNLSGLKIVLYVLRHTWGYQDDYKKITIDEFANGRKSKDGERIDRGTGLSKPSIVSGCKWAVSNGYLYEKKDDSDGARIKKYYALTERGLKTLTPDVKNFNTCGKESLHRTEKETIEKETTDINYIEWLEVLGFWKRHFPTKPQPRPSNTKLQKKCNSRLSKSNFRKSWKTALEKAAANPKLHEHGWFDLEFFLDNDEKYKKILNGKYDWMLPKQQSGSNGVNKQELLTEIETAVSTYGRTRYKLAMETMSTQAKETVAKMGKWAYVCSLPAKQLQVEFYRACNS